VRDPRYDVLFEPVPLGPVTARNRFFQVPHCNGMGHAYPSAHAEMRGVKAEGGWAVVCTEEVELHHSTDVAGYIEGRLWDDADIPMHALLVEKVHEHGSLAGIELVHSGMTAANLYVRQPPMGPANLPVQTTDPVQARRMSKADIADLRRWHRAAVERSLRAGYDLVYVYAAHGLTTLQHFLSRRYNDRSDEYGGSVENRARLLREILEDTVETVAGRAAVACRICVDEQLGDRGIDRAEIEEVLGLVGELPDVWDFMVGEWENDSLSSRFAEEGAQEVYVRGLKALTSKPVVGVGRFTSADTMVRMVRDGVLDMIGSARPSIADPFLPRKIEEGRWDDIRECIGCNICVTGDATATPIRCTQNPSMGEEWRRGWHPERIRPKESDASVLVVGGGPSGLEAAMMLGRRGYAVVLAEAGDDVGGRVALEARLPGLAAWIRVVDYRRSQLARLSNVEVGLGSPLDAAEAASYGFDHIAVATGARWRADGVGRWHTRPLDLGAGVQVLTPDDLLPGTLPDGERVLVYDDDHYFMGGALCEVLRKAGREVTLVTPESLASAWTTNTMEQSRIQGRLLELGVEVVVSRALAGAANGSATTACVFTEAERAHPCDAVVLVTGRLPNDALAGELAAAGAGATVRAIGDAMSPGTIAAAVWDGRRYAEELDAPPSDDTLPPFRREVVQLAVELGPGPAGRGQAPVAGR
jgi:dimethylamine/trimethylamine dehydrogenase